MSQYDGYELAGLREAHNYYSWMIQEYNSFIEGKVLEVGAGIGTFSRYVLRLPIQELVCLEPASKLIPSLKQNLSSKSVKIAPQTLAEFEVNSFELFDTIVCINVLEHIEDDYQALVIMNRLLKTGGNLCLFVPAIPWLYGTLDENMDTHG